MYTSRLIDKDLTPFGVLMRWRRKNEESFKVLNSVIALSQDNRIFVFLASNNVGGTFIHVIQHLNLCVDTKNKRFKNLGVQHNMR